MSLPETGNTFAYPISVLLVEDDSHILEEMVFWLQPEVSRLLTAKDGKEGLDLFLEETPDVIITDIRMPRMDGLEMARKIKKVSPDTPIVVISAFHEERYLTEALDLGLTRFLFKPLQHDHLHRVLSRIAQSISYRQEMDRKTNELWQSRQILKTLLQVNEEGILILELKSQRILEANPAAAAFLQSGENALQNLPLRHFFPNPLAPSGKKEYTILTAKGESRTFQGGVKEVPGSQPSIALFCFRST